MDLVGQLILAHCVDLREELLVLTEIEKGERRSGWLAKDTCIANACEKKNKSKFAAQPPTYISLW